MSIDNRVVQMEFDNKKFESNAKESIGTIGRLKKSLNFGESAKSLSNLEKAGNKFSLDGMGRGIDIISNRFTTMGLIGVTTIQNLTNSAINAGKQFIKSLTIDPVKTGLDEYETKMNAITTIMTNTASKGTTLDEVNKTLEDLNLYADKTIYNFAQMTRNIGTFTAAGIGLEDSATAIKGIANLAAGSGSTSQQASTAMYQLSQALAAGSVKLQDWNSVVNAGMGGELFQNALKKTAKAMGVVVNESVPFRESLKDGWITSEVLIKTLKDFSEDEMLLKAATQVKTFTQLIDTMKESVQSGWGQSWENIIGDKDEAASLFTALNDGFGAVVGKAADARNEMLKFWKENKGREYVIRGIANVLLFLGQVIQPIKDAWAEIFPPMTGKRLVELSKKFMEFTSKLKIGDKTSENIRRTFKGLFAVLNIGKELFFSVAKGVGSLISYFSPTSIGVLDLTGNIGDLLNRLSETVTQGHIFSKIIQKIGYIVEPVGKVIKNVISKISEAFSKFDFTSMEKFKKSTYDIFKPFIKFGELLGVVWSKVSPVLKVIWDALGNFFDDLKIRISNVTTGDLKNLFDMLLSGGLIVAVTKFIRGTGKITTTLSEMVNKITDVLGTVKDTLKTYQKEIKANIIQKIAIAVGILAASLVALTFVNPDNITMALVSIGTLLALVTTSLVVISKQLGDKHLTVKMSLTLVALASAVSILAKSISTIAGIETGENKAGVVAALSSVVIMLASLVGVAVAITKFKVDPKQVKKTGIALIPMTLAVFILGKALASLGTLPTPDLFKGGIAILALMGALGVFVKLCQAISTKGRIVENGDMIKIGLGAIAVAGAMLLFAKSIVKFGIIPPEQLKQGGIAIAALMVYLGVLSYIAKDATKFLSVGIGMVAIAKALEMMIPTIMTLGTMPINELQQGGIALAGILSFMGILAYMSKDTLKFLSVGAGMMAIGVALNVMMGSISQLAAMDPDQMWIAVGGLSALMVTMGILAALSSTGSGPALLGLALAIGALAVSLKILGSLTWEQLGVALVGFVVGLGALTAAIILLTPLAPGISALAIAILQLSGAVALAGIGVAAFAIGLGILNVVGVGAIAILGALAVGIVGAVVGAVVALAKATPILIEALSIIIIGILQLICNIAQPLADTIVYLVIVVLETLEKNAPTIIEGLIKLIGTILKTIGDMLYNWGFEAGMKLGEALDNMWTSAKNKFDKTVTRMKEFGGNIIQGLINGIKNTPLVKAITAVGGAVLDTFKKVFDINSPSREGYELGEYVSKGLGNGIKENGHYPSFAAGVVGGDAMREMAKSIEDNSDKPVDAVKDVMGDVAKQFTTSSFSAGAAGRGLTETVSKALTGSSNTNLATSLGTYLNDMLDTPNGMFDPPKDDKTSSKSMSDELDKISKSMAATDKNAEKTSKTLDEAYQNSVDWINDRKYYNELSLEDELAAWERVQKRYAIGSEERKNADKEVYRVKKEITEKIKQLEKESYQNSVDWIDDRKYYNELSLKDELAAWRRVQNRYLVGSEERKNADKEVYRVKKEITEKLEKLDKDYYDKQKEINDKLQNDIKETNDSYNDSVNSRAKTLYDSYGLFDKVEKDREKVSGTELFTNLNDQVLEMRSWEDELSKLSGKGVSKGLIEELQAMGPKAVDKIKALNTMSESRLDDYVDLWVAKHNIAHNQAVYELDGLRMDTDKTINKLNSDAKIELEKYKQTWIDETKNLRSAVTTEFQSFTDGIKNILEGQDWKSTGLNILNKVVSGFLNAPSGIGHLLSKALNLEDVDNSPVIKPVLDLSNIEAGKKQLNLMTSQGLLAGAIVSDAARNKASNSTSNVTNNIDEKVVINNTYNVRNNTDIKTIDDNLKNIFNKRNNARGVLVP